MKYLIDRYLKIVKLEKWSRSSAKNDQSFEPTNVKVYLVQDQLIARDVKLKLFPGMFNYRFP